MSSDPFFSAVQLSDFAVAALPSNHERAMIDLPEDGQLVPSHVIGEIFRKMDHSDEDGPAGVRESSRRGQSGPLIEGEGAAALAE
jgi:hypothetical protein